MSVELLKGWTPARIRWRQSRPVVEWRYMGKLRFTEPFFDETITKSLRHPFAMLFHHETGIEVLGDLHAESAGIGPTGFIFHTSRCGSTLVSQMLAALRRNIVISEAGPIDSILRARLSKGGVTDDERITWLRWVVNAYGQKRHDEERYLFIKFDSWNALDIGLIERAFPGVPWIFMYRDPVKVLASHLRRRGAHTVAGLIEPELFGLSRDAIARMRQDEYLARVLARTYEAGLEHYESGRGMLVNYSQLPVVVWTRLADFFRVRYTTADVEALSRAARFDAKNPALEFEDNSAAKRGAATDDLRQLAESWLVPVYERLEAARAQETFTPGEPTFGQDLETPSRV